MRSQASTSPGSWTDNNRNERCHIRYATEVLPKFDITTKVQFRLLLGPDIARMEHRLCHLHLTAGVVSQG